MARLNLRTKERLAKKVKEITNNYLRVDLNWITKEGVASWYDYSGISFIGGLSGRFIEKLFVKAVAKKAGLRKLRRVQFNHAGNGHHSMTFRKC